MSIASSPSDRHVFFVDDLDAFKMIEEKLVTFVCETATASKWSWTQLLHLLSHVVMSSIA